MMKQSRKCLTREHHNLGRETQSGLAGARRAVECGATALLVLLTACGRISEEATHDTNADEEDIAAELLAASDPDSAAVLTFDPNAKGFTALEIPESAPAHQSVPALESSAPSPWNIEIIDEGPLSGWGISLATDSMGRLHVSYFNANRRQVKYGLRVNGLWTIETIDEVFAANMNTSIQVDRRNRPHIAYRGSGGQLRYAKKTAAGWIRRDVHRLGPAPDAADGISLALDGANRPHITNVYTHTGAVVYSHLVSGKWIAELITYASEGYLRTDLVLDSDGLAHFAAYMRENLYTGELATIYGQRSSMGTWSLVLANTNHGCNGSPAIAIRNDGLPIVATGCDWGAGTEPNRYDIWFVGMGKTGDDVVAVKSFPRYVSFAINRAGVYRAAIESDAKIYYLTYNRETWARTIQRLPLVSSFAFAPSLGRGPQIAYLDFDAFTGSYRAAVATRD